MNQETTRTIMKQCKRMSSLLGALAHPIRLKILCLLNENEMTVTSLTKACDTSQPSMSQFLLRMKEDGLLDSRREAQRIYYSISDKRLLNLLTAIREVYCK